MAIMDLGRIPLLGRLLRRRNAPAPAAAVRESFEGSPFASGSVDPDEGEWRPLGAGRDKIDLSPDDWERSVIQSYWQWFSNPVARRIIQITRDFTLGAGGIEYDAENDTVRGWLEDHWSDSCNSWDLKQFERVQDLFIFGELILPAFVKKSSGRVRLGYIFPTNVERVETAPGNPDRVTHVILKDRVAATATDGTEAIPLKDRRDRHGFEEPDAPGLPRRLKVIDVDDDPRSPTYGRLVGDVFYFAINKTGGSLRGTSDLLPLNEWLDGLDRIMLNRMDDRILQSAFIWDVKLEGAQQNDIDAWEDRHAKAPRPNQVIVHNEQETWEVKSPNLNSSDAEVDIRMLRQHILSGAGYPETWFADTANSNRASATEAGVPTFKQLQLRQLFIRKMFERILRFVVDQKRIALPMLARRVDSFEFSVNVPQVERRDTAMQVGTLASWTTTLSAAEDRGYIRPDTARRGFAFMASQIGFDIDPDEEAEPEDDLDAFDPDAEMATDDALEVGAEEDIVDLDRFDETADDVASRYAGVTRAQVKGWARRGCPHFRNPVNGRLMFDGAAVDAWLRSLGTGRGAAAIEGVAEALGLPAVEADA